nr:hypothetical protein [Cytophagales bacterium]
MKNLAFSNKDSIMIETSVNRKFGNLLEIPDNFPKYVVTMDEVTDTTTPKGINRMHVKDFCLKMV